MARCEKSRHSLGMLGVLLFFIVGDIVCVIVMCLNKCVFDRVCVFGIVSCSLDWV